MFTKKERCIFKFWNGERNIGGDPLAIQRKLITFPDFNLEVDLKLLQLANEESLNAFDRLVRAARHAFKVKDFEVDEDGNESGLLDTEMIELIVDFGTFLTDVKKNIEPSPGPLNSSGVKLQNGGANRPPMKPMSASFSTER
jgi:hypothetical protein